MAVSARNARSAAGPVSAEAGRRRSQCKECGGGSICGSMAVSAIDARSAAGPVSVYGRQRSLYARIAAGPVSVSMAVSAILAGSAAGPVFRSRCRRSQCKECGGAIKKKQ